ncbi:flavohemoglobin expression-modulating QEGLA motif protein [Candidatus Pacebacteria bacterium]|nr:flavohemoglobin expression-modulating QEGLA motif protein [Candidatus Paceibacterota bacterium]
MSKDVLDERWFKSVNSRHVLNQFRIDSISAVPHKERTRFLENEVENPAFRPPKTVVDKPFDPTAERAFWEQLLTDLTAEDNILVRELYERKVTQQIDLIEMLRASLDRDNEHFSKQTELVYGKPKKKYFLYIAKRIQELTEAEPSLQFPDAWQRTKKLFSKIDVSRCDISPDLLPAPVIDTDLVTSAEQVEKMFTDKFKQYGLENWSMVIDETGTRRIFSVNGTKRIVHVPNTKSLLNRKKKLTKTSLSALAAHEIGVHALRSHNGKEQPLQLLHLGLDNYLRGEEGLASYKQQLIEGADEYYGFDKYLAASLAAGLDGTARDFRSVFEIMQDYYLVILPQTEAVLNHARATAWNTCVRIFRGSDGQGAGCIYTKDINYLEGNIRVWEMMKSEPMSDEQLLLGKYDPTNQEHRDLLSELEILV